MYRASSADGLARAVNALGGGTGAPSPAAPLDVSPYGVQSMAGTAREWCDGPLDVELLVDEQGRARLPRADDRDATGLRLLRGGSWADPGQICVSARRSRMEGWTASYVVSFRLARSLV